MILPRSTEEYECCLGHKPLRFVSSLSLTNMERLMGHVKFKGSLACSNHEMEKYKTLRALMRAHSKLTTVGLRRADWGLFTNLLGRMPWTKALEGRGAPET